MGVVINYPIRNLDELQEGDLARAEKLRDTRFDWRGKHMKSCRLARLYELAGWKEYAIRAAACARYTEFGYWVDSKDRKLQNANFCHLRLCPMCTARRARKNAMKLSQVMNQVEVKYGLEFIFLTLTVQNCTGDKLGDALTMLAQGWDRLIRQRPVLRVCKGWYRALEITRNNDPDSEWYGTYHPHIHDILAVEPDYFLEESGKYLTHDDWMKRWRIACRLDYDPTVYVEKTKEGKHGLGAVLEASKYVTKDKDFISRNITDEDGAQIVEDYTKALFKRRLVAFGGVMKDIAAQIGADKDDGDLVHIDDEGIREDLADYIENYGWHFGAGDYILTDRRVNPLKVVRQDGADR